MSRRFIEGNYARLRGLRDVLMLELQEFVFSDFATVIPANAGIQAAGYELGALDTGFHRYDGEMDVKSHDPCIPHRPGLEPGSINV